MKRELDRAGKKAGKLSAQLGRLSAGSFFVLTGSHRQVSRGLREIDQIGQGRRKRLIRVRVDGRDSLVSNLLTEIQVVVPEKMEEAARVVARLRKGRVARRVAWESGRSSECIAPVEALRSLLLSIQADFPTLIIIEMDRMLGLDTWLTLEQLVRPSYEGLPSLGLGGITATPPFCIGVPTQSKPEWSEIERLVKSCGGTWVRSDSVEESSLLEYLGKGEMVAKLMDVCGGDLPFLGRVINDLPGKPGDWLQAQVGRLGSNARDLGQLLSAAHSPLSPHQARIVLGLNEFEWQQALRDFTQADFLGNGPLLTLHSRARDVSFEADPNKIQETSRALAKLREDEWISIGKLEKLEESILHYAQADETESVGRLAPICLDALMLNNLPHRAELLLKGLEAHSEQSKSTPSLALRKAEAYMALGRSDDARILAEEYLTENLLQKGAECIRQGRLLLAFGMPAPLLSLLENFPSNAPLSEQEGVRELMSDAQQALGDSLQSLATLQALPITGRRLVSQGNIHLTQGDESKALMLYKDSLQEEDPIAQMRAHHNMGIIDLRAGEYESAVRSLRAALEVSAEAQEYFGAALCKVNLALAYEHLEHFGLAREFLLEAIDLLNRQNRARNLAGAMVAMSDLLRRFGATRQSIRLAKESIAIAESGGFSLEAADGLLKLGHAELERGRVGVARETLERALPALSKSGHPEEIGKAWLLLAECAVERNDPEEITRCFQAFDALPLQSNSERFAERALLEGIGQTHSPQIAAGYFEEAIDSSRVAKQREPEIRARLLLSRSFKDMERWEEAQGEETQALQVLQSLEKSIPSGFRERFRGRRLFAIALEHDGHCDLTPEHIEPNRSAENRPLGFEKLVGSDPAHILCLTQAARLGKVDSDVMLRGESGTGKELLAEAIVGTGDRKKKPFIRVNSASLSDSLLASELFGHEKGAFTGALRTTKGKIEQAAGGTLFLDEIGDISPRGQVSLLRVLQERTFVRVGGATPIHANVRFLFATNAPLEEKVANGTFREDLYHRICGLQLHVPSLSERQSDVMELAEYFLAELNKKDRTFVILNKEVREWLTKRLWSGNIRQLKHAIESAFIMREEDELQVLDFESTLSSPSCRRDMSQELSSQPREGSSFDGAVRGLEIDLIAQALEKTDGNITKAAQALDMSRPRLSQKIKEYGLKKGVGRD